MNKKLKSTTKKNNFKHTNKDKFKDEVKSSKFNHFIWYNKFPALIDTAAKVSFGNIMGNSTPFGDIIDLQHLGDEGFNKQAQSDVSFPGLCVLRTIPTIGISHDASSAVNNMSRLVYSFIRHANSGSRNYESTDYMTYLLAVGSVYAVIASLIRAYGLLRSYSVKNRFVAYQTVKALGFDPDDLSKNLANFRYYINYVISRVNSLAVPKDFAYYDRVSTLTLNVFKDTVDEKSGFYAFEYNHLYKWNALSGTGSELNPIAWYSSEDKTLDDIQNVVESMLNALLYNEDIGIMSGDTLKAFGSSGLRTVAPIPEDYAIVPVYDEMMLWQIHNATFDTTLLQYATSEMLSIKQQGTPEVGSYLVFNPQWRVNVAATDVAQYAMLGHNSSRIVLDSPEEVPSVEFVVEATRLQARFSKSKVDDQDQVDMAVVTCGTEIIGGIDVYSLDSAELVSDAVGPQEMIGRVSDSLSLSFILSYATLWNFQLAPSVTIFGLGTDLKATPFRLGDLYNYTTVDIAFNDNLHNACLLSLFVVPNSAQAAK